MLSKLRSFLNTPVPLFFLVGLYPAVFLASKNWFVCTDAQIKTALSLSTLFVGAAGLGVYTVALGVRALALRFWKDERKAACVKSLTNGFVGVFCCCVFVFLMQSAIFADSQRLLLAGFVTLAAVVCATLLAAKAGFFPLNIMLLCMTLMAAINWGVSYREASRVASLKYDKARDDAIQFKSTPNIYLIFSESYTSPRAIERFYGSRNQAFFDAMTERGFHISPDNFSSYPYTLGCQTAIFSMQHHYYRQQAGKEDFLAARDMIGGKTYNPVLQVLSNNGYKNQYVQPDNYLFFPGPPLQFCYPRPVALRGLEIYQVPLINKAVDKWVGLPTYRYTERRDLMAQTAANPKSEGEIVQERILAASKSDEPYFTFLQSGYVGHTLGLWSAEEIDEWTSVYPARLEKANADLLDLTELIAGNDPEAIIVIYGDHGGGIYRGVDEGGERFERLCEEMDIQDDDITLDLFGAFVAVRYPGGDAALLDGVTSANYFLRIFAALSGDKSLLDDAADDSSYFLQKGQLFETVRDGKALEAWQAVDIP